jgi:hypothetical protein
MLEGQAVALQAAEARHVALGPTGREVLDRALLVGKEDKHVHTGDLAGPRRTARPSRCRGDTTA